MNELVFQSSKGNPVTNSLLVAKKFGKHHKHVLESIDFLVAENSAARFFHKTTYANRGKDYPMYLMNRDGFSLLVMGFTGAKALRFKIEFIHAFNKMEETLRKGIDFSDPNAVLMLARNWADEQKRRIEAEKRIHELAPKAELMDRVLDSDDLIDFGQAAKILGLPFGRNTLLKKMRQKGILFANRNEPKQEYVNRGYFTVKEKFIERNDHPGFVVLKVLITQKGLNYLSKLFKTDKPIKKMAAIE
ncbi:phage regulatory protein/antirepressor Ant [Sunxiuqinia indica]|uniref:phage regulatory protein/antirepressor Ant n=1 Tax=Sunxiuqinia indica TaxID=2692584 RepID=UPI001359A039|nr:phage regulatory protein/antirepressor Ant [Sunxiuqinia indica]